MRTFLKYVIIILVLLAVLAGILMAVSPKNMVFEESETIAAPPQLVFNLVNDLKKWENWSPWMEMDPNAKNSYTEKTAGIGAQWNWDGNKDIGKGYQKIVESVAGEKIRTELGFDGWDGVSYSNWNFAADGNKTRVSWDFEGGDTPFFLRPFNLLMKGGLTKTYQKGLSKIKEIAEERSKNKIYNGYKINEEEIGEKHYIMNRAEIDIDKFQQFYSKNISNLFIKTQGANMEMDGMPSGLFFKWDPVSGKTDMAAAIPVKEGMSIDGASSFSTTAGRAIVVDYIGDPSGSQAAHFAIDDYIKDYGLLVNYPVVEEYVTDPSEEKDPAKWKTRITYFVSSQN